MTEHIKVFVVGPAFLQQVSWIFEKRRDTFKLVETPEDAEMIVLTGGEDINPALYGEKPLRYTSFNAARDDYEINIINNNPDKVFVGICRGAQLLNVVKGGGKMWQHITGHGGSPHEIHDVLTGRPTFVNSLHHQGMIPGPKAQIVAYANHAEAKFRDGGEFHRNPTNEDRDMEVLWYPDEVCLCFQAHPEFGHIPTRNYFFDIISDLVIPAVEERRKGGATCAA